MGLSNTVRGQIRQAERVDGEILRTIVRDQLPDTLSLAELELDRYQVTRPPVAEPVWAWVRYGTEAVRVKAEIVGWTDKACAVRWEVPKVGIHKCWVWIGAVEDRSRRPRPGE